MKNYVQKGDVLPLAAPYAVAAGAGALIGALFGVAVNGLGNGETGDFMTEGVFDLTKEASLAISTVGARVFWDNTNKCVTTTNTSNYCIGYAVAAALDTDATVRVKLDRPNASAA
jgi:predicted RecA/RadA family phage recombinase